MCDSRQPLNGADSAEALAPKPWTAHDYITRAYERTASVDSMIARLHEYGYEIRPIQCAACSLPAVTDGLCAGHARLGEYRTTDETTWAANE